jgi:hypothetical protein
LSVPIGRIERMFDTVIEGPIPAGLDQMPPGPVLAALLSAIDVTEVSGHDRVTVLRAHQRLVSHYTAELYRDMAAVTNSYETLTNGSFEALEGAAAEIRTALCLTRRAADSELSFALDLKERLPRVWNALGAGDIDVRHARVMVSATIHLDETSARDVTGRVLDEAAELTTGQLAARIRRLCIESDAEEARERFEHAVEQRRVVTTPDPAGTTNLYALDLAPDRAAAAMQRINRIARDLKTDAETRNMDQLRADVLLDLLEGTGTNYAAGRGVVDIHVDLTTLTELAESPGELAGYGPVIADIAKQVTKQQQASEWRYTVTDPEHGRVAHNGVTRRRPTTTERRHIEVRNQTCVFPGCRMPATACDLDHRFPWNQGGPTHTDNLAPLCRHDHVIRHQAGWAYTTQPDHNHRWTSPLGHTYTTTHKPP